MPVPAMALGLPPGLSFKPEDDELVKLYLLPRARGQPAKISGVVIEDDATSAAVPPWDLLTRHGRTTKNNDVCFFERRAVGDDDDGGARQDRRCGGSWTWVSQRRTPDKVLRLPSGEEVSWNRRDLNLHRGRGRSGSTGWVMHEYTITSPPCPFPVKLCHVAFTGHGQKRQRVPDGVHASSPSGHERATSSSPASEASTISFADQELRREEYQEPGGQETCAGQEEPSVVASLIPAGQELGGPLAHDPPQQPQDLDLEAYCALLASDDGLQLHQQMSHLLGGLPANAETAACHAAHIQMPPPQLLQQEPGTMQPPMDHGSPMPWDDLDAFCSVPQPEDNRDMAAGTPAGDGATSFWDWDWDGAFEGQGPV